jgi:hypothetical protein
MGGSAVPVSRKAGNHVIHDRSDASRVYGIVKIASSKTARWVREICRGLHLASRRVPIIKTEGPRKLLSRLTGR